MKKNLIASIAALLFATTLTATAAVNVTVHFDQKRQTIVGNGMNMEGYHMSGGWEVLKTSIANALYALPCDYVRIGMHIPGWEQTNDNDDPNVINFDGFRTNATDISNSFKRLVRMQDEGYKLWLSVWDMEEWNLVKNADGKYGKSKHKIKSMDELAESITAYLLWAKQEYDVEVDWLSINEPSIASENNYGGYYIGMTAEEQASIIKKAGALFEKHGLKTKWLIAVHKVYPSETDQAIEIFSDEEVKPYLGGFDFHGYYQENSVNNLKKWGDFMATTGLPSICGELDYNSEMWELSKEEKAKWGVLGPKSAQLYANAYNLAYVAGGSPWFPHTPSLTTPYRYVALHYHTHLPAGTQVVVSESDNDYIMPVAAEKGDDWVVILFNRNSVSKEVTLKNLKGNSAKVIVSYDGTYGKTIEPITIVNGEATLTLPAQSLYSIGNNIADLTETGTDEPDLPPYEIPENNVEAESGTVGGGSAVSYSKKGFTGTGYIDYGNSGSWNEVVLTNIPADGNYYVSIRYATGNARPCDLYVDGAKVATYACEATADWDTWEVETHQVALKKGDNTLKLVATASAGGPNVDAYSWNSELSGIVMPEALAIRIYPNPATTTLYVEGMEGEMNATIRNSAGQLMMQGACNGMLDVSNLVNGFYLLQLQGEAGNTTQSFIKK